MIGTTLSHYRITAALGAGGMGEVFQATDTTLNREVAIKVLPAEVAGDPERLARFRREAQLLAALNHPNIAAIHGLEEAKGKPFLALELVEGEDLKERLERGAIPVDEALEIAEKIAEALEEAHNRGIVHRDLKPANVKITPDGKVKVLDFGLAKAWAGDAGEGASSASMSQSPTLAHSGTAAGIILGTAAYMSPEQARGKPVDKRADVWSFGVLLWEMLTGHPIFAGDTVTDVIAAVVRQEIDFDGLPAGAPASVRRLLARCLRKDPRSRLPDIGAARLELQDALSGTAVEGEPPSARIGGALEKARGRHRRERRAWMAAFLVAAGAGMLVAYRHLTEVPERRSAAHFVLDTPDDVQFSRWSPLALSPDGRHLAFIGASPGEDPQMWIRPLDSPEAHPLPGTVGARGGLFWSPDGQSIAFEAGGVLRKLALAGGTVQTVCDLPDGFESGTWSQEGTIVFAAGEGDARLYSVSQAGGEARPLTSHDESRGEWSHLWPQFLPDGRRLLFTVSSATADDHAGLHVLSLEAPERRQRVSPDTARHLFVPPGYLLFVRDGTLLAQRFDPRNLVASGEAVPLASPVATFFMLPDWGWFSASGDDRVSWLSGLGPGELRLEWVDREGRGVGTLGEPARYNQLALSPDDRRVAVEITDADGMHDTWVFDVARGVPSRITTDPGNERQPVWSPDGQELLLTSDASGDDDFFRKALQGSEPAAPLPGGIGQTPGVRDLPEAWIREGDTLLYLTIGDERTLWAVSLEGDAKPEALLKGFGVDEPRVSPDGQWLAYVSRESGRFEIYVEPFRRRGEKVRVSVEGGGQPRWRGDGKELFYLSLEGALMAVDVRVGERGIDVGLPTTLIPASELRAVVRAPGYDDYEVTSDGQRFLVKRSVEEDAGQRIHVLLDWPSLLE